MSNGKEGNVEEILELALAIRRDLKDLFVGLDLKLDSMHEDLIEISHGLKRHNGMTKRWMNAMMAGDAKRAISYLPDDVQARIKLQ
jgi:glutathione synthase/RimK-type ligase-like ATP-grasp enzyme